MNANMAPITVCVKKQLFAITLLHQCCVFSLQTRPPLWHLGARVARFT